MAAKLAAIGAYSLHRQPAPSTRTLRPVPSDPVVAMKHPPVLAAFVGALVAFTFVMVLPIAVFGAMRSGSPYSLLFLGMPVFFAFTFWSMYSVVGKKVDRVRSSVETGATLQSSARRLAVVPLVILLAGCGSDQVYSERMANVCKFQACVCIKRAALIITQKPIPVLWHGKDGAYCPDGYSIQRARRTTERDDP